MAVIVSNAQQLYEVWISDIESPRLKRMVAEPGMDCYPRIWHQSATPADLRLYPATRRGKGIYTRPVDGSNPPVKLVSGGEVQSTLQAEALSPDGASLLVSTEETRGLRIGLLTLDADDPGVGTPEDLPELADAFSLGFSPRRQVAGLYLRCLRPQRGLRAPFPPRWKPRA